jgi:predicted RNA methylase
VKRDRPNPFDGMRSALRAGVTAVAVPQLFETPVDLAARAVGYAELGSGMTVLEPSAGTGRLLGAIIGTGFDLDVTAVEIDGRLAERLDCCFPDVSVVRTCFLKFASLFRGARFDRIIMNPPFGDGADVKHVQEAVRLLRPGGRVVAFCANGPRQQRALLARVSRWEPVPPGAFRGTNVSAAIIQIEAGR